MPGTTTTYGARDHARAQAGLRVETMPTVPASAATDLPAGVDPATLVWDETVAGGGYASRAVRRGVRIRLVDLRGDACAGLLLHNAVQPSERLNVADTVKVQWQAYLTQDSLLLSDMGRALATIVHDTSTRHDTLCGCSNRATNMQRYGSGAPHGSAPNGRDHFAVALAKHGLDRRDIAPNVNFFKQVRVEADGSLRWHGSGSDAGAAVELLTEMPLIMTVVNVPHVLDPRPGYEVTPLRIIAWKTRPTARADRAWTTSPERERAYLNTAEYLAGLEGEQ
jgi:urea carboxylase-associated protein 2